ncbi:MAG: mannonate dehydratase, partial [Stellaceae bacterium]
MHVGTQIRPRDDDDYRVWAQLGVTHVCVDPPGNPHHWRRDDIERHREHVESFGLSLDMVQLPMSSAPIEEQESPNILLAKEPERQREIDSICALIERLAAAGIPAAKYNLTILGIPRTEREPGRGGARNAAFRWDRVDPNAAPTAAGIVSEDEYWARIDHFLAAVVPVATAAKLRLACHPQDPYTPPGWRGVTSVLGTVEGLKRFVAMHESPYHGLNFCQGTVCEMLADPAREIFDVIRWFGARGKLFNVHFRNIKGRRLDFIEAFPDEGDIDMA